MRCSGTVVIALFLAGCQRSVEAPAAVSPATPTPGFVCADRALSLREPDDWRRIVDDPSRVAWTPNSGAAHRVTLVWNTVPGVGEPRLAGRIDGVIEHEVGREWGTAGIRLKSCRTTGLKVGTAQVIDSELAGGALRLRQYRFADRRRQYVLSGLAPTAEFDDLAATLQTMAESIRWVEGQP